MLAAVLRLTRNILHFLLVHETKHLTNIHFDTKLDLFQGGIDMHCPKAHTFTSFTKIRSYDFIYIFIYHSRLL